MSLRCCPFRRQEQPASTLLRTHRRHAQEGQEGQEGGPEVKARLAQEQAEAEARRSHDQEVADKAAWVQEQEDDFSRREAELEKLETDMKAKLEGLDAEVLLRARRIAAAEAREAATESRAVEREEKASQKIMSFRDDEASCDSRK